MNKGTDSEADSSIINNATRGSILSVNKGTGSEANSSLKCDQIEHFLGSSVNSIIELSILITCLNFHQSYFSNFAFKY